MATMAYETGNPSRNPYDTRAQQHTSEYQWHGAHGKGRLRDTSAKSGDRQYAMFTHLAGLLSIFDFSVLGFVATLVMWQIRKDDSAFLDDHGKEAVNFQISLFLYALILAIASIPIVIVTLGLGFLIIVPLAIGLFLLRVVGSICAAVAANRGEFYRYPMCWRLIK
ncbi:MAG: DUF4870 domain-containing protein [Phycisphaerales bacterium]